MSGKSSFRSLGGEEQRMGWRGKKPEAFLSYVSRRFEILKRADSFFCGWHGSRTYTTRFIRGVALSTWKRGEEKGDEEKEGRKRKEGGRIAIG